ncbi:DUF1798 family protein [Lentibacillus sp. N15]|uniref:DUF1798 family protein n=1 Tax=Lentibacillus songyuanensis TaxID=3136161 RepID=UPI0031BB8133
MTGLQEQTETLKEHLNQLKKRYEDNHPPEDRRDKDFFMYVRQQTEAIYKLVETWEGTSLKAIKDRTLNIHPQQITSTRENMELLLMHSFYIDVKQRRYMELYKSIQYIYDQMLRDMNE